MAKKMTATEARNILADAGYDKEIYDWAAILNHISILASEASKYEKQIGHDALAEWYENTSNTIYDELRAIGYYDNVR